MYSFDVLFLVRSVFQRYLVEEMPWVFEENHSNCLKTILAVFFQVYVDWGLADLDIFHPEYGMILANTTSIGMQPKVDETPLSKVSPPSCCSFRCELLCISLNEERAKPSKYIWIYKTPIQNLYIYKNPKSNPHLTLVIHLSLLGCKISCLNRRFFYYTLLLSWHLQR